MNQRLIPLLSCLVLVVAAFLSWHSRVDDASKSDDDDLFARFTIPWNGKREQIDAQRERVKQAKAWMEAIRDCHQLTDLDPDSPQSRVRLGPGSAYMQKQWAKYRANRAQQAAHWEAKMKEQEQVVKKRQWQLKEITHMKPSEIEDALRVLEIDDHSISRMVQIYREAKQREQTLVRSGATYSDIKDFRAQVGIFEKNLTGALSSLRENHSALLEIEKRSLERDREYFEMLSAPGPVHHGPTAGGYHSAKQAYIKEKAKLDALLQ